MKSIRVLAVDDHAVFLEGLVTLIRIEDSGIEVIGTAFNGQEALELDDRLRPDVVLLDIQMPVMDGVEVARRIKERRPESKILMLTTFNDRKLITDALAVGANGYLLKDAHSEEVIRAIKSVHDGHVLMSADVAKSLSQVPTEKPTPETGTVGASNVDPERIEDLTKREREVLELLSRGKSNAEISEELFLSEKTVRNYVSHIYDVLNIHSRTRAALWATRNLRGGDEDDAQP